MTMEIGAFVQKKIIKYHLVIATSINFNFIAYKN